MNKAQQKRLDSLYRKYLSVRKRQGKAELTIDLYSRASEYFDNPTYTLSQEQLKGYSESLISSHFWSTVKVDRNGLQLLYKHVLKRGWQWVDIIKPPQEKNLPNVLIAKDLEWLINSAHERRYHNFILTCFSMGLRLGKPIAFAWPISTANEAFCMCAMRKARKAASSSCPRWHCRHYARTGQPIETPPCSFLSEAHRSLSKPLSETLAFS
ncbi:hypothetical protein [uncultured Microbulbifer sp.]|uniref:hypothetical protein n=1 Tax=uncultured Microbulbifer sp. TaxID=348147 RepID=UPI0026144666|nr:hypothetical protein [uncultured Microbulbifer sp.]